MTNRGESDVSTCNNAIFSGLRNGSCRGGAAFTLVEGVMAMAIVGIVFVALYAGITHGFTTVQLARENLRATQIMTEHIEMLRLCHWNKIDRHYVPQTFQASYYPPDDGETVRARDLSKPKKGGKSLYTGQFIITNFPQGLNYSTNLKMVTVRVTWTSGGKQHQRQMTTSVARQGLHRYLY